MIDLVCNYISNKKTDHPLRVAIDGIDAAGKTKLAKELVFPLRRTQRKIIHISQDTFLQPSHIRYRRGRESPEGYYYDSINYPLLINNILDPLSPGGSLQIRKSIFDFSKDTTTEQSLEVVENDAILLFDGVFLFRNELFNYWDIKIFVDINFEVAMDRVLDRDINKFESINKLRRMYENRYFSGQRIYFEVCHPKTIADIVVDNNDPRDPYVQIQRPVT
jgi:uridine kinase